MICLRLFRLTSFIQFDNVIANKRNRVEQHMIIRRLVRSLIAWRNRAIGRNQMRKAVAFMSACLGILLSQAIPAAAFEAGPRNCTDLCAPLAPAQLDTYRAQGLDASPGGKPMQLSVILWDEYRRAGTT